MYTEKKKKSFADEAFKANSVRSFAKRKRE